MTTQQVGLMQEFPARAKRRAEQALAQATLAQARSLSMAEQQMVETLGKMLRQVD